MNKVILTAIMASAISAVLGGIAQAAPNANIKIAGNITPPTCMVNGSSESELSFALGSLSPVTIPLNSVYRGFPAISNTLSVVCDANTYLTFKASDSYPIDDILVPGENARKKGELFSLVDATNTVNAVGTVTYQWKNVTVDGKSSYISRANDGEFDDGIWTGATTLIREATNGWTSSQQMYASGNALNLQLGKIFTADIYNVAAYTTLYSRTLLAGKNIDLTEGLNYIGQTVLTFNFAI